ncbi:hypothetical protein ACVWW5_002938 [Bradyrhizobium sp. LM3.4]
MPARLRMLLRRRAISPSGNIMCIAVRAGELQQAPTAKIGLLANASLRVEPYTTPYQILPHP